MFVFSKEFNGFRYSHVKHVIDVLVVEPYLQNVMLKALAMAGFTFQNEVSHELHLNIDDACSLAFLTSSAFGVE